MSDIFITGTNTEVGKTHVAAMIARALSDSGRKVGVYKPVASGCRRDGKEIVADDAVQLWEAAGRPATLEQVCPQRFLAPVAPHRAAALEGKRVDAELLRTGFEPWCESYEIVIVEGAGGLLSPISAKNSEYGDYNVDLARDLGLPLVVVAANELGVINATMQTLLTAKTLAPELTVAGVVLNQIRQLPDDASLTSNAEELAEQCEAPLLATVGFGETEFREAVQWSKL